MVQRSEKKSAWNVLLCGMLLVMAVRVNAQYRPAGAAGSASGDIGRISIELPIKSPVYTATVQLYMGEQQVATRSLKKDSVADKSRIVEVRNLKEGLYTLKIESPGMPDMLNQVFVRNEKDAVKVYIDYPESAFPQKMGGMDPGGMNELMLRLNRMEERLEILEKNKGKASSSRSTRGKKAAKPKPLPDLNVPSETDGAQQSSSGPETSAQQVASEDDLADPVEKKPVKVEKGKKKKPKKANTREKPEEELGGA